MESSKSIDTKEINQTKTHVCRQRAKLRHIQNVLLIWLDSSANDNTDDCRNTVAQLQRAVNDVNTYIDGEQCIQFIQTIKNNKACMVVSGALGQYVVPRVHNMLQVEAIFVFCGNKRRHEQWAKDWPKIRGVFTEITPICKALQQAARQCEQNATPMSFVTCDATGDRLDPSFMYTQIFKEILLTIDFNEQHIREYVDYSREAFRDNPTELKNIRQLERHYRERTPIWWYTCESFLYPMLNRALRTMNGDIMVRMGFFVNDLHRHVEREHRRQSASCFSSTAFTVHRGQGLTKTDFEQLRKIKGGLLSFNCFLSTSKRRSVSLNFAQKATSNPDLVGILFEMTIDPSQATTPFASISELTATRGEDEVLFAMHSVFRVREIKRMDENGRLYEVHLSLTNDNDPQLRALTDRIREESFPDNEGWYRLALVLDQMGQLEKAEEICGALLNTEANKSNRAHIYNKLGIIKRKQGAYEEAIKFDRKALEINQKSLPPTHPSLAMSYGNIGEVYRSMGDYPKALASHMKALTIRQQSLPPTHPDLATSYNNIGAVYYSIGDYPKALVSHEKTLAIQQQFLPPTHPNLAMSYGNIGGVYNSMGNYPKALASYKKAVTIKQQSLPPTHSSLAMSYNNIGVVYENMGSYSTARSFSERAVEVGEQSLPPNHPNLQTWRRNLDRIKKKL